MGKNILIVVGSERETGNSMQLAKAFRRGAEQAGHTVTLFVPGSIHGCIGCDACLPTEHRFTCIFEDAMQDIYGHYEQYDGIVLASPIYDFMISAQAKLFFDRLYACQFAKNRKKDAWLLLCAADRDEDVFDPAIAWFRHAKVKMGGWTERGILKAYGVQHPGDLDSRPELIAQAEEMGRNA